MSHRIKVSLSPKEIAAIEDHPDWQPSGGTRSGISGWLYQAAMEKLEMPATDYHEERARYWAEKKAESNKP